MSAAKATILLVDDEPTDIDLTHYIFNKLQLDHPVVVAKDGRQAIDQLTAALISAANNEKPLNIGLVLLDLNMPGVDGFEVLTWRNTQPALRLIPFVVLTASNFDSDREKALALGASEFCVKPQSLVEFKTLVKDLHDRWLAGKKPDPCSPAFDCGLA